MAGIDKIVAEILDEARREANAVMEKAKAEADSVLNQARAAAEEESRKIAAKAEQSIDELMHSREAELSLRRRRQVLQMKQELLRETFDQILQALRGLPQPEYFSFLIRQAARFAEPGDGQMMLSPADVQRLPPDFEARLAAALPAGCRIVLSGETRQIDGGFVLKYGDIEQNCSFSAIVDARREELTDKLSTMLFNGL